MSIPEETIRKTWASTREAAFKHWPRQERHWCWKAEVYDDGPRVRVWGMDLPPFDEAPRMDARIEHVAFHFARNERDGHLRVTCNGIILEESA